MHINLPSYILCLEKLSLEAVHGNQKNCVAGKKATILVDK